ncbi:hypothetical protein D3C81_1634860 [compost metagenome]
MVYLADHSAELLVGHWVWRSGINRTFDSGSLDAEINQPGDVSEVNPGQPLLTAANLSAKAECIGQLHLGKCAALVAEHNTGAQLDQPYLFVGFVSSLFPHLHYL